MPNCITKILCVLLAFSSLAFAGNTAGGEDAQQLITSGLAYLQSQQKGDASWQNAAEPVGVTAIVLKAFVQQPSYTSHSPFIARGYAKLLSNQLDSGGIYKDSLACYNTAISISALAAAHDPAFRPAIDKAVAYLKNLQWVGDATTPEGNRFDQSWYGGFGYGGGKTGGSRPDLSNTQMALDALHDAGIPKDDPAYVAAVTFVTSLQNRKASNTAAWATDDGGFIYSPGPTGQGESPSGAYLDAQANRHLRSYGSMTYAGLKSFIYAGLSKDDPRVQAAFVWISGHYTLDENPGMAAADPANARFGLYYYYVTLSRALHAYDAPQITDANSQSHDWRIELINKLAKEQHPDGSWSGEKRWMENNPILVTAYSVLSLEEAVDDLRGSASK